MNRHNNASMNPRWGWVAAAVSCVLLWRIAAYFSPSSFVAIPDGLQLPLALLGIVFLVTSLWAWWARPNRWTGIFLVYGLSLGIHWGGAIGVGNASLEVSLFWVYLAITALGDAALLNLALIYPHRRRLALKWHVALYAPAAIALLLAPFAGFAPRTTLASAAGLVLLVANLLSLTGGIVFLIRLFTVDGATRRAARLPLIVMGMVSGSVIALLGAGGLLPGVPEAWNLALGLVPIALAVALISESVDLTHDEQSAETKVTP